MANAHEKLSLLEAAYGVCLDANQRPSASAVAAGVTGRLWSLDELVERTSN